MDQSQPGRHLKFVRKPLNPEEIHVWQVRLDRDPIYVNTLFRTLSLDERRKAGNYHFDRDRDRFIVGRGTLREILGSYLGLTAGQISFAYNEFGKPFLEMRGNRVNFNVTHSRGLALIAITAGREVGIDIEFVDADFPIAKVAGRIFPPAEYSALQDLDPELQILAFFQSWTRREAYFKAFGTGFSPHGEPFGSGGVNGWVSADLSIDSKYMAAVAVRGRIAATLYC
jgi:4'-phosphopantetheinyl transferase